tara:strand:- start:12561 stop:12983 length:423 start_codon:yes stop_codon:yes gene_type:complete
MKVRNTLYGLLLAIVALSGVQSSALARELTTSDQKIVADAIKDRLRDAASAMFKWGALEGVVTPADDNSSSAIYCGYVNSRNAYGGFVGDTPYGIFLMFVDDAVVSAVVLGLGGARRETNAAYQFCAQNGYGAGYFAGLR